ncbi:hypothetical protein [Escherichia sp. E2586]|nr:hypothetical protein [Escherichia sp. E2586]
MSKTIAAMVLIRLKIDETFSEAGADAQGCAARARLTGMLPRARTDSRKK